MRATDQKSAATTVAKSKASFFSKEGGHALSSTVDQEQPFFMKSGEPPVQAKSEPGFFSHTTPTTIQAKCDQCEKEEQPDKKDISEGETDVVQQKECTEQGNGENNTDTGADLIQAKCDHCEKEEEQQEDKLVQEKSEEPDAEGQHLPIQTKLSVGEPGDPYEREADAMADKVVQQLAGPAAAAKTTDTTTTVQQQCNTCDTFQPKTAEKDIQKEEDEQPEPVMEIRRAGAGDIPPESPPADDAGDTGQDNNNSATNSSGATEVLVQRRCRECEEGDRVFTKLSAVVQRSASSSGNGSREAVVAAAKSQIGKVEAKHADGSGKRVGAQYLLEYFHKAAPGVWDDSIIETAGADMPSWCGIFSVWAHKKAGLDIGNWQMGKGVSAFGKLKPTTSPQAGDIGYIHDPNQHHCIVVKIDGDNVHSIDGNSGLFSEVIENVRPMAKYDLFLTAFGGGSGSVQRQAEDGVVQEKSENTGSEVPASVESRIQSSKGSGDQLPDNVRGNMEEHMGADFSDVKIHTGSDAAQMSSDIHALAFTHGNDIYFKDGEYDPESKTGQHLLAHELTHTIQQGASSVQKKDAPDIQKQDGTDHLTSLNEMLDSFDVPEEDVISQLRLLTDTERTTVLTDPTYRTRMASALDVGQMVQAVNILHPTLEEKLKWVKAAAYSDSSISYSDISAMITDTNTPQTERDALKVSTEVGKSFFTSVCDNSTIITAVADLHFDLVTQLEWIKEEASASSLDYSDIQALITVADQPNRDKLKTNDWRDFFVGVCTNSTIITAVTDLHFDLETQMNWIKEEAAASSLAYSDIQALITAADQPNRDKLKTNDWRDFFVGVCTNSTIITAVKDLGFDLITQMEWIEEEASPSSLAYSDIQSIITAADQPSRDKLKTIGWRDFFVGVCDNTTIKTALDDLHFDMLTAIQWLLEEASVSNVDYTWLCNLFKASNAFPAGEDVIACAIMERDIRDGTFDTSADHRPPAWITRAHTQLGVANEMGSMVGDTARWRPSGRGSGTTFQVWASAPAQGPTPTLSALTVINCWEMVMLAAFRSGALTWPRIHAIYTSGAPDWFAFLVNELSFNNRIPYNPASPASRPVAGDIVFFDGAGHIALAKGTLDGVGRTEIYSFWPPPNTAFTAGGTIDQVKITTIEELNDYWVASGRPAFVIEYATPNW